MANSSTKNFEFPKMVSEWAGYNSSRDKTNVQENVMVQGSQNIYKKLNGNLSVREGQSRRGEANATQSPISSEYVWNTSWGETYTMVVADGNLSVVVDDVWYELMATSQTRYVFDKWWNSSLSKDQTVFVNGTTNLYSWSGGFGLISSTTANTIVLDRTIALSYITAASGTVVVNGTTYTYTGSAGSTLTGVTPDPSGEANGSGVLQSVVTTANTPTSTFTSDFLKIINNQVYLGSYTSLQVFMSQNTNYLNYVVPSPQLDGSPGLFILDGTGRGIGVRNGNAYVGFGSSGWAEISFTLVSNNSIITRNNKIDIKPVAIGQAPYAHEFIDNVGDNIVYLGQDQQMRAIGDFNNLFVSGYPSFSQEIATELSAENFAGGGLRCIGEFIYITAPASGKVYLRQERTTVDFNGNIVAERLWHSPFIWNVTRIDDLNGEVIGFSNANPQIYNLWNTDQWYDDSPSDEELPYSCVLALGYRTNNRRQGLQLFDKLFTEGYLTPGTPLNFTLNYDYQGSTSVVNGVINSVAQPTTTFGGQDPSSLGDSSLGDESLGDSEGSEEDGLLVKFKNINSLSDQNCFEYQPILSSDTANARWELLALATNAEKSTLQDATFIINKLN